MDIVTSRWRLFFHRQRHAPAAPVSMPAAHGRRASMAVATLATLAAAAAFGLAVTGLLFPAAAFAADGGVAQLRRFVEATPQATGRFTQTLIKEGGVTARPSSGRFAYARPGRFRWDIQKPYEQLIVTDGKQLHFYDKDLQQVTIRPVSESMSATPAALLFGSGEIDRAFKLVDEAGKGSDFKGSNDRGSDGRGSDGIGDDGLAWVVATPLSKEAGFERLRIGMRQGVPARMEVIDAFGQQSRFEFDDIDPKANIAADQFRFVTPPGVDVVQ